MLKLGFGNIYHYILYLRCDCTCSEKEVESLSDSHDLCIGGDCFEKLQRTGAVIQVIPYVKVRNDIYLLKQLMCIVVKSYEKHHYMITGLCAGCS